MPWHRQAMKDVVTCDKSRIGGSNLRPGNLRMGKPSTGNAVLSISEFIGYVKTTQGTETSKYLEEEKTKVIS